jgi:hypothetical protein
MKLTVLKTLATLQRVAFFVGPHLPYLVAVPDFFAALVGVLLAREYEDG